MSKKTGTTTSKPASRTEASKSTSKATGKSRKTASPAASKPARKPAKRRSAAKAAAQTSTDSAARVRMIEETAYFIAEARGFSGGSPMDDWLTAETLVDQQLSGQGN